jgi:Ser/Thr protein kinase RdoA (MazF antagonist)
MGCVDRRLERLAGQLEGLLTDTAALAGLSERECERLPALVPHLQRLCTRLAQYPLPQTLVHGDLYLKNVAYNAGQYQFFDWSDACVTHPFFDMMTIYTEKDPRVYLPLRDTYLTLWTDYAPLAQLLEVWELAAPLSYLHQAIGYQHIVAGLEPSAQAEFRNAAPYYVRQALQAITLRHLEL